MSSEEESANDRHMADWLASQKHRIDAQHAATAGQHIPGGNELRHLTNKLLESIQVGKACGGLSSLAAGTERFLFNVVNSQHAAVISAASTGMAATPIAALAAAAGGGVTFATVLGGMAAAGGPAPSVMAALAAKVGLAAPSALSTIAATTAPAAPSALATIATQVPTMAPSALAQINAGLVAKASTDTAVGVAAAATGYGTLAVFSSVALAAVVAYYAGKGIYHLYQATPASSNPALLTAYAAADAPCGRSEVAAAQRERLMRFVHFASAAYEKTPEAFLNHLRQRGESEVKIVRAAWQSRVQRPAYVVCDVPDIGRVVAVRGTANAKDALTDIIADTQALTDESHTKDFRVHSGIGTGAKLIVAETGNDLASIEVPVTFVGHSLGAGTAAVAAALLWNRGNRNVRSIGFATPAVASSPLALQMKQYATNVILGRDAIPRLSFASVTRMAGMPVEDKYNLETPGVVHHLVPLKCSTSKNKDQSAVSAAFALVHARAEEFARILFYAGTAMLRHHFISEYACALKTTLPNTSRSKL